MDKNIHRELEEIAPTLAGLDKKNPFLVPDGYFDSIGENVFYSLGENLRNGRQIPDHYFANLPDVVLSQVEEKKTTKIISFYNKSWLSIAASLVLILGAFYIFKLQIQSPEVNEEFAIEIDADEALDYLIENDDLYLTDLFTMVEYEEDFVEESDEFEFIEDADLDDFLEGLDAAELEDLL